MQDSVTQDRYKYLGGSDMPAVMGISPFTSRWDMLCFKAQLKENDFNGNAATRYGNDMEASIRDFLNEKYKFHFEEAKKIVGNEDTLPIRYHADGFDKDKNYMLEVKTTSEMHDEVGEYKMYLVQLLLGMEVYDCPDGVLAVYERPEDMILEFNKDRLQVWEIQREDYSDLYDEIHTAIDKFNKDLDYLKENPLASEEELPSMQGLQEVTKQTVSVGGMDLSLEWLLANEKSLTDAIKDLKEQLCEAMEEHQIKHVEFESGARATYVAKGKDTESEKFNEKAFEKDHPKMYKEYLETKVRKGKKAYVLVKH